MVQNEDEDNDDDADEDEDTPSLAASQALDALALSLPPEKYISALLSQVQLEQSSGFCWNRMLMKSSL